MRLVSGFVLFCTVFNFHRCNDQEKTNKTVKEELKQLTNDIQIRFDEINASFNAQQQELDRWEGSLELCSSADQFNTLQTRMATDECQTQTHNCSSHATCIDNTLFFQCSCLEGYSGDGYTCEDLDECTDKPNICSQNEKCINVDGSYRCCFEVEELGCISLEKQNMTWNESRNQCVANGASLANNFNKQQLISIRELFDADDAVWVGVKSCEFVGPNNDVTGVPDDDLWESGEPDGSKESNNDCGFVNNNNSSSPSLNDIECSFRKYSLCQFINY